MNNLRESILDGPLVFVDVETNGLNSVRGRVIEVAVIRVEHGVIVRTFNSLLDPETPLPQFISDLTGIQAHQLVGAPTFEQIAEELYDVMDGALFVAHNVRFDYSFLKQEFARVDQAFLPKQLCTVKLSRALYPMERGHKLADLIKRHNFNYTNRHRAYDDAAVLWQFIKHVRTNFPAEQVAAAIARQISQPALPRNLESEITRNLPETPGVYIFEDSEGKPLYIGKSINIKQRVLSHFGRDHASSKEFKIAQTVKRVEIKQTSGELSALLLESRLIKELQPLYNQRLRKLETVLLAKQYETSDGYITVRLEEAHHIDPHGVASILAVYPRRSRAKDSLDDMVKTFELCPKLLGLEKTSSSCFLYQLHKCHGACIGQETATAYNDRLLTAFEHLRIQAWPFNGPILIEELSNTEEARGIIVDTWCIIGEIAKEDYCDPVIKSQDMSFDLDTYKILRSFLTTKTHEVKIQKLSDEQLQDIFAL